MENKVLRLLKDATLPNGITFKSGTEFEIVSGVVYMGGVPIMQSTQTTIFNWIKNNPRLFLNDTRRW